MSHNPATVPQAKPQRSKTVKVSALVPSALHRRVKLVAKADRRCVSPQIVVLLEEALAAREVAAA